MKTNIIIIAIVIIAVVVVGAFAALTMTTNTAEPQKNNITASGSKVTVINNNKQVWAHWDLVVENATLKNGTKQSFYIEVFVKPGENATIDLSNMLGYGNAPLPTDTTLTILGWGGLYNTTAGGTSKFDTTFLGWTTNQTIPSPATNYKNNINALNIDPVQPVGPLPSSIVNNTVIIGTTAAEAEGTFDSDSYEQLFANIVIVIGPNGVPYFRLPSAPTLCTTIAHII